MDFARKFSLFYDNSNDDQIDYSILLPITVGLGTIVASLLLRFRSHIFGNPSLTLTPQLSALEISHVHRDTMRHTGLKKKSAKSVIPKQGALNDVTSPEKTTYSALVNTTAVLPASAPCPPLVTIQPNRKVSPKHSFTELHSYDTVNHAVTVTHEPEISRTQPKKNKKSKRSSVQPTTSESTFVSEIVEADPTWVVVTSKKFKSSNGTNERSQSSSKSKKRSKNKNGGSSNIPILDDNKLPQCSVESPASPAAIDPPLQKDISMAVSGGNSDKKNTFKSEIQESERVHTTDTKVMISMIHPSGRLLPDGPLGHSSTIPSPDNKTHTLPIEHHSNAPREAVLTEEKIIANQPHSTTPSLSLSYGNEKLISECLLAQLQAKEAECQLLRSEIIDLRNKLKSLKSSAPVPLKPEMVNIEVMTDTVPSVNSTTENSVKPVPSTKLSDPDSVLLTTLQAEIARLVKETVIYQQRSENLKSRLDTANKKLSDSKSRFSDELKASQAFCEKQVELVQLLQADKTHLESELNEALKKGEMQRRKFEESEHTCAQHLEELERLRQDHKTLSNKQEQLQKLNTMNQEERERLIREYNGLTSRHSSVLNELSMSKSHVESLNKQLREFEEQLASLKNENQVLLTQSKQQIETLESTLSKYKETEMAVDHTNSQLNFTDLDVNALIEKRDQLLLELNELRQLVSKAKQDSPQQKEEYTETDSLDNDLLTQVAHYKAALDATEGVLSKLQKSVNEEEIKWRQALDASTVECELLQSKVEKLETTLTNLMHERTLLNTTIEELKAEATSKSGDKMEEQLSIESASSPIHSSLLMDYYSANEEMSKTELVNLVAKLRCLVQVEHEALKREQCKSSELQAKLDSRLVPIQQPNSRVVTLFGVDTDLPLANGTLDKNVLKDFNVDSDHHLHETVDCDNCVDNGKQEAQVRSVKLEFNQPEHLAKQNDLHFEPDHNHIANGLSNDKSEIT